MSSDKLTQEQQLALEAENQRLRGLLEYDLKKLQGTRKLLESACMGCKINRLNAKDGIVGAVSCVHRKTDREVTIAQALSTPAPRPSGIVRLAKMAAKTYTASNHPQAAKKVDEAYEALTPEERDFLEGVEL